MNAASRQIRSQMISLCHVMREDTWSVVQAAACRLMLDLTGGNTALLFLADVTGQSVQLSAVQSLGNSNWAPPELIIPVGPASGSHCPLSQVAQTGQTLVFNDGPKGYDFSRLSCVIRAPLLPHRALLIPLRSKQNSGLLGIFLITDDCDLLNPLDEGELRLLVETLADILSQKRLEHVKAERARSTAERLSRIEHEEGLRRRLETQASEKRLIGSSQLMRNLRSRLPGLANLSKPILLLGEDGCGRELVARELHEQSRRRRARFVYLNCSLVGQDGLAAELFGFKRGAIPGLSSARRGLLREASLGTLYLDRVDLLPAEMQSILFRVLETGHFRALGSERDIKLETNIIASAALDFPTQAETGRFLPSLYFQLNGAILRVPSLEQRRGDIPDIVEATLDEHITESGDRLDLAPDALAFLASRTYRGNLRELTALVKRAADHAQAGEISLGVAHVTKALGETADHAEQPETTHGLRIILERLEADLIRRALCSCHGDRNQAAQVLRIPKRTLADKCKKYAL